MIKRLYIQNSSLPGFSLTVAALCFIVSLTVFLFPDLYSHLAMAYPASHPWQYVSGIFLHGTADHSGAMLVLHLSANMLLFLPYAVLTEKALGPRIFALSFLSALAASSLTFQISARLFIKTAGDTASGAGLSALAYTFIAPASFMIFTRCRQNIRKAFRESLTYVFLLGFFGQILILNPRLAGIGSFIMHLQGLLSGILLSFIFRRRLRLYASGSEAPSAGRGDSPSTEG